MTRLALDKALPAQWIDEVFQEHRRRQYLRELLFFSAVVELMALVTLGLRPSLPGHTLVVYDPDSAQVCGIVACEDAYESERVGALALIERAQAGRAWIGERHFCTKAILQGLHEHAAGFIARSHVATDRGLKTAVKRR